MPVSTATAAWSGIKMDDQDRAIADFDHAIKLDPDPASCVHRGIISHRRRPDVS
jgi:hypothetical protein